MLQLPRYPSFCRLFQGFSLYHQSWFSFLVYIAWNYCIWFMGNFVRLLKSSGRYNESKAFQKSMKANANDNLYSFAQLILLLWFAIYFSKASSKASSPCWFVQRVVYCVFFIIVIMISLNILKDYMTIKKSHFFKFIIHSTVIYIWKKLW